MLHLWTPHASWSTSLLTSHPPAAFVCVVALQFLNRELAEEGYAGVEVKATPIKTEIIIRATRTQNVLGEKGRRIRELTAVVQKRFGFPEGGLEMYAERVFNKGLCAQAQAESLKYKLLGGLQVRRAIYGEFVSLCAETVVVSPCR